MTMKDEWLGAAMTDDKLVVELLLRLKQSHEPSHPSSSSRSMKPPAPPSSCSHLTLPPLDWGMRQPRSKLFTSSNSSSSAVAAGNNRKKESTRRSPTTPLSWSAGCGGGGGGASPSDGYEESTMTSRPSSSSVATVAVSDLFGSSSCRSKGAAASNENTTSSGKRPRRKKTFVELKDEESTLMNERVNLKKELDNLRITLKDERSLNENLKRIKLDLCVESVIKSDAKVRVSNLCFQREAISTTNDPSTSVPRHVKCEPVVAESTSSGQRKDPTPQESSDDHGFVLPDLNMMPDLNMIPEDDAAVIGVGAC